MAAGQVKGERVQCPWHKWCINVKTGQIGDMEDIVRGKECILQGTNWLCMLKEGGP